MLDIGWSEMAVIALVALVVIGPKDLPKVMRSVGQWVRKARAVSREFQSSIDEMIREADLEDAKKAIQSTKNFNIDRALDETIDPTGEFKKEVRSIEAAGRDDGGSVSKAPKADSAAKDDAASAPKAEPAAKAGSAEDATPGAATGATVIQHPAQPAPPHSVVPPKEPASESAAAPAAEPAPSETPAKTSDASGQKSA